MSLKIIRGNIFTTNCKTIVNTINCVGVMGAGIALECRLRYPDMYQKYQKLCNNKEIAIGMLWLYKTDDKWILNIPTKNHWRFPSKKEYLHAGLDKFVNTYQARKIDSIAFPLLGADRGGLDPDESLIIMKSYLDQLTIEIEIYRYDPKASDDLYIKLRTWMLNNDIEEISRLTKLRNDYVIKVVESMNRPDILQLNQLGRIKGIGIKTIEKLFRTACESKSVGESSNKPKQMTIDEVLISIPKRKK